MKRIWRDWAHWEKAKGKAKSNYEYWTKEHNILASKGFEQMLKRNNEY
jgi:hypothetical protein